ncbi:MAG TPA: TIGR02266 family protein [Kofleriaceae bacterium]
MADPNTRQGKRTPVTLKIKFKSETLEQFIERYAVDVSQGGIFIRTKDPLAVGTQMKFEFQLRDASPLIAGEGTVVWTRENDPSRPAIAPGMGVRFDRLGDGSQSVLEKILAEKAKQAPQRGPSEPSKPPLFTDVPTRVAPIPVQDALMGDRSGRTRADSEQTPLPKPVPFHSDADEFGAEAFEEATKVRALDELVAATAGEDTSSTSEDLSLRRPPGPLATAVQPTDDRDSAPALPSVPEAASGSNSGRVGKLLDTSPSPRQQTPSSPPLRPSQPGIASSPMPGMPASTPTSSKDEPARTKLGVEPARAPRPSASPVAPIAEPPEQRSSSAPMVIGALVVIAAAFAVVWYFVLRTPAIEEVANNQGSATPVPPPPTPGSAIAPIDNGSAVAQVGSNGSAAVTAPKGPTVDTQIAANAPNAQVTVVETGDTGPAPFKAKLEKDKSYKVRVEAPGFTVAELDVKGGQDQAAKLVAKPHVLSVTSTPAGAQIMIDSSGIGRVTPYDVELTAAQAAKPKLRVSLRKVGYRQSDTIVMASSFKDDDKQMVATVEATMSPAPVSVPVTHVNPPPQTGSATTGPSPEGSGATEPANSGGSAAPSTDSGPATSPTAPTPAPTAGSGEPEPDFVKKPTP